MPAQTSSVQQQSLQNTSKDIKTSSNNQLNTNTGGNKTPLEHPEYIKQAQSIIEKKVKNLEKRRKKLEEYQELQKSGTALNEDQLLAVSKYGEVKVSIELAKDLDSQLITLANETIKALKKQAKKEQLERDEQLKDKVKEVQKIQSLLNTFSNETVRNDFLEGRNGATQLNQQEIDLFEKFRNLSCSTQFSKTVENDLNESVDHLMNLVENKTKSVLSTTYSELKKLFERVMTSSYWTYEPEQQEQQQQEQQQAEPQQEEVQQQEQPVQSESQDSEQKQSVNYQQNTSTDDYVIVSTQEVENTQTEQQQQQFIQDQRTFFSTLNAQENINQFLNENNDGINFLQDSEIPQEEEQSQQQQQQTSVQEHQQQQQQQQQFVSNNNQQPQQGGNDFSGNNSGFNQYGRQRHYNNDNQNYQPRNGNGGYRRPYNPSDKSDRPRGGGRGGYQGGRGGPQGGGRGGLRGNGNYKPRGGPSGNYRNNNQQPVEASN